MLRHRPIPTARWTYIAMDVIVALPFSKNKLNSIMVVIDRLATRAHFVACSTSATAFEVAQLYCDHALNLRGIPEEVVSDRDSKFTARFWVELCSLLGTKHKMSTALLIVRPRKLLTRFYEWQL